MENDDTNLFGDTLGSMYVEWVMVLLAKLLFELLRVPALNKLDPGRTTSQCKARLCRSTFTYIFVKTVALLWHACFEPRFSRGRQPPK